MDSSKFGAMECFEEDVKTFCIQHAFAFSCHRCMPSLRCIYFGEYHV